MKSEFEKVSQQVYIFLFFFNPFWALIYMENLYLIKKFYSLTNVQMLLNTSFNENEPVVSTPR